MGRHYKPRTCLAYCITCHGPLTRRGLIRGGVQRWGCSQCETSFSEGSSRNSGVYKPDQYAAATALLVQGFSTRQVERAIGLSKATVNKYRHILARNTRLVCACGNTAGHKGWCNWRIGTSAGRQSYLAKCAALSAASLARVRLRQPSMLTTWPYVRRYDNDDYALMKYVNELVPRTLPEHVRADVCQDILVDVVSGEIALDGLKGRIQEYIKRAYKFMPSKFGPLSLDAFIYGDEGRTLGDTLIG